MLKHLAVIFTAVIAAGIVIGAHLSSGPVLPDSTVKVSAGAGHGSGFYIGHDMVITAHHVIDSATDNKVMIKTEGGDIVEGEVLWASQKYDVAAIRVHLAVSPAYLSCTIPQYGTDFTIRGNPLNEEFVSVWGRVSGVSRERGRWASAIPISASVIPGQSGGPVYGKDGSVIGMVVGAMVARLGMGGSLTGIGVAVPGKTICGLMGR